MLLVTFALNAALTGLCILLELDWSRVLVLCLPLSLIEFIALKQLRAACALWMWSWFYIHQSFLTNLVPDLVLSILLMGLGFWISLGIERNRHQGEIRPAFIVCTILLYFIPFQPSYPSYGVILISWSYFLLFALLCWVKDHREEELVTVFYHIISTTWLLMTNHTNPLILIGEVGFFILLLWNVHAIYLSEVTVVTSTKPLPPKRRKRKQRDREFTAKDGFYMGLKLLQEDEFIAASLNPSTGMMEVKEVVAADDPVVLADQQAFAL